MAGAFAWEIAIRVDVPHVLSQKDSLLRGWVLNEHCSLTRLNITARAGEAKRRQIQCSPPRHCFAGLIAPMGSIEICQRNRHQQIAQGSWVENAGVVDDGERIHLNNPCPGLAPGPPGFPAPQRAADRRCACRPSDHCSGIRRDERLDFKVMTPSGSFSLCEETT